MSLEQEMPNLLVSYLLDAVINENITEVKYLMKHKAPPNMIVKDKGFAPIHYCAGMENTDFSEEAMDILLEHQGDPNVQTVLERLTPLHIACMGGHSNIVSKLMRHGGDINIKDEDGITPIQYAIDESHYDIVLLIKNFIFEKKIEKTKSNIKEGPMKTTLVANNLLLQKLEESQYTPNNRNYNFDITSPYYVKITHRNKSSRPLFHFSPEGPLSRSTNALMESTRITTTDANLFDLTEDNLMEFTRVHNPNRNRDSLIDIWRTKVKQPSNSSILKLHKNLDELLSEFELVNVETDSKRTSETGSTIITAQNELIPSADTGSDVPNESFYTADNNHDPPNILIKSPINEVILQVAENYLHTDNEIGMVFYEKKLLPSTVSHRALDLNASSSSLSTSFTVPSDYGTEELRNELVTFGHIPGPITKSTKRLYLKRLIKFKRSKDKMSQNAMPANDVTQNFSIELRKTIKNEEWFKGIDKYLDLEKEMMESIKNLPQRALREGRLKTSFVYLLIDPRISDNLPGQYKFLSKSQTWEKFLGSVFYVGKGKSSRPYSHLYDAIQFYNELADAEEKENCNIKEFRNLKITDSDEEILFIDRETAPNNRHLQALQRPFSAAKSNRCKKTIELTKKLNRIVSIWQSKRGVVCLHLFHNSLPTEAYTREAAIIDCLTLNHLTNKKSGDYYGITKTWTMRSKKNLGVGLLYRAMQTYLAQGESQLMPRDLL